MFKTWYSNILYYLLLYMKGNMGAWKKVSMQIITFSHDNKIEKQIKLSC